MAMTYFELEEVFGKKIISECSKLYQKHVIEQLGGTGGAKKVLAGVDTYLSRINPLIGGNVNTNEILEIVTETKFWDQVVLLNIYYSRMQKQKKKRLQKEEQINLPPVQDITSPPEGDSEVMPMDRNKCKGDKGGKKGGK